MGKESARMVSGREMLITTNKRLEDQNQDLLVKHRELTALNEKHLNEVQELLKSNKRRQQTIKELEGDKKEYTSARAERLANSEVVGDLREENKRLSKQLNEKDNLLLLYKQNAEQHLNKHQDSVEQLQMESKQRQEVQAHSKQLEQTIEVLTEEKTQLNQIKSELEKKVKKTI